MAAPTPRREGTLAKWNDERGFGFIAPADGSREVFVHATAFERGGARPQPGEAVSFVTRTGSDGQSQAAHVMWTSRRHPPRRSDGRGRGLILVAFAALLLALTVWFDLNPWVIAIYAGLSAITALAYAIDKSAARAGRRRVAESTLLLSGLTGGWPGAMIAQLGLRHKNRKPEFMSIFWVTVVINLAALLIVTWLKPF